MFTQHVMILGFGVFFGFVLFHSLEKSHEAEKKKI